MNTNTIFALPLIAALSLTGGAVMAHGDGGKGDRPEFSDLDTNGDGGIDAAELQANAAARFAEMDTDGNGSLSVEEMTAKAGDNERRMKRATKRAEKMIKRMDENGDGALSADEMDFEARTAKMLKRADKDGDGKISEEEFEAKSGKRKGKRKDKKSDENEG